MPPRLQAALALTAALLSAGCAQPPAIPPTAVEVCPPAPPAVTCPDLPGRGDTLRDLLLAWAAAEAAHAECRAALRSWHTAYSACR